MNAQLRELIAQYRAVNGLVDSCDVADELEAALAAPKEAGADLLAEVGDLVLRMDDEAREEYDRCIREQADESAFAAAVSKQATVNRIGLALGVLANPPGDQRQEEVDAALDAAGDRGLSPPPEAAAAVGEGPHEELCEELLALAEWDFNAECCNSTFPINMLRRVCNEAAAALAAPTGPQPAGGGVDDFDSWWRASKYCQVSYGEHRQVALDGWNAAKGDRNA